MNSLWLNYTKNKFNKLDEDISTDICIVGSGIFGLTCGYYLTKLGYNVVILEKEPEIASKTTGHTTAKLTSQHNLIYKYLIDSLGIYKAKQYLYANQEAIENVYQIIRDENIDCDFKRQDSYVYTHNKDELEKIKLENEAVNSLGFNSEFVTSTPLPFDVLGAIKFSNQAQFNPIKYAYGLANCITYGEISSSDNLYSVKSSNSNKKFNSVISDCKKLNLNYNRYEENNSSKNSNSYEASFTDNSNSFKSAKGIGKIYTNTFVQNIEKKDNNYVTSCKNHVVRSKYVILASHYPFIDRLGYYFLKMYQSTSYVIAVDIGNKTFNGMYINSEQPTFSYRFANSNDYNEKKLLLVGGADHKTGSKIDLSNSYNILEAEVRKYYPDCKVLYKWNTEDCISLDKIPYIGEFSHFMPNMYIGTGFNKWGMTSSNVAANIIVNKILGRETEYEDIFEATRLHPIKNNQEFGNMIKETAYSLVINKFKVPEVGANEDDFINVSLSSTKEDNNTSSYVDNFDEYSFDKVGNKDVSVSKKASAFSKNNDISISTEKIFAELENDTGHVLEYNGQKVGVYKNSNGKIFTVNPICTHLGCLLSWNNLDKTWDCPCHGSRFDYMGHQLYNPAIKDLKVIEY